MIMRIICSVQMILTLLFFGLWLKMRSHLSLQKYLNQEPEEESSSAEAVEVEDDEEVDIDNWLFKLRQKVKPYQ